MHLIIKSDATDAIAVAGLEVIEKINSFVPSPEKLKFVVGLSTGDTLVKLYRYLSEKHKEGQLSFENCYLVALDEYFGVSRRHPRSIHTLLFNALFSRIEIDPENVFLLNGEAPDAEAECERFQQILDDMGGIDLCILQMDEEARLGFNEPGSSLASLCRPKILCDTTVEQLHFLFANSGGDTPKRALTVGLQTIMESDAIVVLSVGAECATAVKHVVEGEVNHMWPASCLQGHGTISLYVDNDAISRLEKRTVEYFERLRVCYEDINPQEEYQSESRILREVLLRSTDFKRGFFHQRLQATV